MRHRPFAIALFAAAAFAHSLPARSATPRPDVEFTRSAKPVLATLHAALSARAATLGQSLSTAATSSATAPAMLGALGDALVAADSDAGTLLDDAATNLDHIATQALADASLPSAAGLVVGEGGAIDAAMVKLDSEAARYSKLAAKAMQKAVRAARVAIPASTFSVRTFPLFVAAPLAPGANPASGQTFFIARGPVVLLAAGGAGGLFLYVGGRGEASGPLFMNVYGADGDLEMTGVPMSASGDRRYRANVTLAGTFTTPHGNLVAESYLDSAGWTASIGY